MSRRGFTLVELLVGLLLASLVATVLTRLMLVQGRLATRFAARAAALESITQAHDWLTTELEPGGATGGTSDLLAIAGDSLVYRAWRGAGLACRVAAGEVRVLRERLDGWRAPQPGRDSLALLLPGDSTHSPTWLRLPVLSVNSSSCGGRPALAIATSPLSPALGSPPYVPVRVYEIALAKLYRSLGEWWLGARSVSAGEGLQPVTGPYQPGGVRFQFRDRSGVPVIAADSAVSVEFELRPVQAVAARWRMLRRNAP
ncbi:MAG: prepilin-type N-terminal cleavage/methylation domain-containing protein [Gemmatimonadales bacterium]